MQGQVDRGKLQISVLPMRLEDAAEAAQLSAELGYPVTAETLRERLRQFAGMQDHAVFAAYWEGRVVGWIDVGIAHHLQSGSYGEIGGLVVSGKYQGGGIGKKLVQAAEDWIASRGIWTMIVRSQIAREGAHAFYQRLDYSRLKTSAVFTKSLGMPKA
jgi:GNAT superfamily N-acetyltransferase